ncbi:tetratricopeptide repeat protein, partial [Candidatus Acetothermia bacterium]|nr:tetratricopeptide repeat protein [Candidatus Acetothermia bacterium]
RWKEKYLSALMHLAEAHARLGHLSSAIECCEKVLEKEAWNENVIRQKMLYLYHMGNQPKALDTFKTCVEALKKHLGVEPTSETRQLYEQILKHQVPPLPRAIPNNLPQQLTSFIGREREIEEIKHLMLDVREQHAAPLQRLVTLTGVGGCGKTRLGLQIASQLLKEYADGVWWVELASLADPNLVVQAIASALGVKEQAGRSLLVTVSDYLHSKQLLLVLDNCEHLIEACAKVVQELLKACPKLQVLVTSREPLGILGETVWQVLPLPVPDVRNLPSVGAVLVSALEEYESVSLFVERARANESRFRLSEENAQATAQICYQLDGIPLAIELAAARVRALSVEQIAARLDDRFRLLTGGNRAALPRHQTLRATMDWSYQLLLEKEQALLRRLSTFAGGWTLEAAEAVCADELIQSQEVMELLTRLVDKSLVLVEKQGEMPRYKLLETVRHYGAEKLKEAGETERVRNWHLDFFLKLAEQAEPELVGPKQREWLDLLEREHDNLRAALTWVLADEKEEKGLRLVGSLGRFWEMGVAIPIGLRAKALRWAGFLMFHQGDYERAKELLKEGLEFSQKIGEKRGVADSLNKLGSIAFMQGDYAAARAFLEQSLAIRRELGDKLGIAVSLSGLGDMAMAQSDYSAAQSLHEQSLAITRELGDKQNMATSLNNLGYVAIAQGDYAAAQRFCEEGLSLRQEIGDKWGLAYSFEGIAKMACMQQAHVERAARLFGAAEALRQVICSPLLPSERISYGYDHDVATLRTALGEEAFAKAWAEGRAMTLDQVIAYALGESEKSGSHSTMNPASSPGS